MMALRRFAICVISLMALTAYADVVTDPDMTVGVGYIQDLVLSPDGSKLAIAHQWRTRVIDVATGAIEARHAAIHEWQWAAAYAPDGNHIATSEGNTITLWDAATGATVRTFTGHTDVVHDLCFSPDGAFLLSASDDMSTRRWDVATGAQAQVYNGEQTRMASVAISPDGTRVVTGHSDGLVRLWDAASGQRLLIFEGDHQWEEVFRVEFSPDGSLVLADCEDLTSRLWDASTGALIHTFSPENRYRTRVRSLFTPDGASVYVYGPSTELWDIATRETQSTGDNRDAAAGIFSPDGAILYRCGIAGSVYAFDMAAGGATLIYDHEYERVLFGGISGDGAQFLVRSNPLVFCDTDTWTFTDWPYFTGAWGWPRFNEDWSLTMTYNALWVRDTGELVRTFPTVSNYYTDIANYFAISPDGTRVLRGGDYGTVTLWDVDTEDPIATCQPFAFSGGATALGFSDDGTWAIVQAIREAILLRIPSLEVVARFGEDGSSGNGASLSGGPYTIGAAGMYWDVRTGTPIRPGLDWGRTDISTDGRWLLWGRYGAMLLDLHTGEIAREFAPRSIIDTVHIHPSGQQIILGIARQLRIWDVSDITAAAPVPIVRHSADTNRNGRIETTELLAAVQIYQAGACHCGGNGSYLPGPGPTNCAPHDSDFIDTPDWRISLSELLRLVQLAQSDSYYASPIHPDGFDLSP